METEVLKVWPEGPPGQAREHDVQEKSVQTEHGWSIVSGVTEPTLHVSLPDEGKRTGGAVLILPGGGYAVLAVDHEGKDIQQWLNGLGVAGIMLKYRLPNGAIMVDMGVAPLQDAQEAMRIIRRHATEWGIDPERVAVLGFSAGGHLAGSLSTLADWEVYEAADDISARPNLSILIYPVISMGSELGHTGSRSNLLGEEPDAERLQRFTLEKQVDNETPPTFLVHSLDDATVPYQNSLVYLEALRKAGILAEAHLYESGGHGYGLGRKGESNETWPASCEAWLKEHGWLESPKQ